MVAKASASDVFVRGVFSWWGRKRSEHWRFPEMISRELLFHLISGIP
jgi:hypothetical protein